MKKCPYCKELIQDDAIKCRFCGSMLDNQSQYHYAGEDGYEREYVLRNNPFDSDPESGKSRGVAALLAILLGVFGAQYFYLGKVGGALITILLSVVTCGIWEVVMIIQGIMMLCMDNRSFVQKYVDTDSMIPLF